MKKVSIVLPTFNEKDNLAYFLEKILAQEKARPGVRFEVIISDSHSKDGTAEIAKKLASKDSRVHYLDVGPGIGVGLIEGHKYALENIKPDVMAQMDADGQVDASVLPRLIDTIDEGYDLALGSRLVKGGKNNLSFSRRLFTNGSSLICRVIMGPWDIKEFTNSARAFTPELFKKINLQRLPWKERTFINQPAFLNEAVRAGAKYKEIPLIFKNRERGYSKNKTFNYTYDVITYAIDARLQKLGLNIPFFKLSRRGKIFLKFGTVGFSGTVIDFVFYKIFISQFGFGLGVAKMASAELAVINNFAWNNAWTFKGRNSSTPIHMRFLIFNLVSAGGIIMAGLIVELLEYLYGDGIFMIGSFGIEYNSIYFLATIPFVMTYNFTANHFITWRHKEPVLVS
jgi:dolichol-phosphate mannosyltransferase